MAAGSTLLAPGGRLVVVGSAGGRLEVGKAAGLERGWGVSAPFWGTRRDLAAVVGFAEAGRIRAEVETYRLGEVLTAYECLRAGRVHGPGCRGARTSEQNQHEEAGECDMRKLAQDLVERAERAPDVVAVIDGEGEHTLRARGHPGG